MYGHLKVHSSILQKYLCHHCVDGEKSVLNMQAYADHVVYLFVLIFAWDGNCGDAYILCRQKVVFRIELKQLID